jgi:hypothetical protein
MSEAADSGACLPERVEPRASGSRRVLTPQGVGIGQAKVCCGLASWRRLTTRNGSSRRGLRVVTGSFVRGALAAGTLRPLLLMHRHGGCVRRARRQTQRRTDRESVQAQRSGRVRIRRLREVRRDLGESSDFPGSTAGGKSRGDPDNGCVRWPVSQPVQRRGDSRRPEPAGHQRPQPSWLVRAGGWERCGRSLGGRSCSVARAGVLACEAGWHRDHWHHRIRHGKARAGASTSALGAACERRARSGTASSSGVSVIGVVEGCGGRPDGGTARLRRPSLRRSSIE